MKYQYETFEKFIEKHKSNDDIQNTQSETHVNYFNIITIFL